MKRTGLIFLMFFASVLPAFSGFKEKLPVKWGKVTTAEFSVLPQGTDKNAPAIVLCDYGNISISNRTFYTRHIRIKILNEAGLKYATVEIPYEVKNKHDDFYELKAQTLVLVNGKTISFKVTQNQIEDIKINDRWHKKKFTFPQVAPGTIIEYRYVLASLDFEKLDTWYFQREIPTIWSEVRFDFPIPFVYLVSFDNNRDLAPDEESVFGEKLQWMYDTRPRKRRIDLAENKFLLYNTGENRYKVWAINNMKKKIVMKNLPGLSVENSMQPAHYRYPQVRFDLFESSGNLPRAFRPLLITTDDDYENRGEWELMFDNSSVSGYIHFRLKTWQQFNESLLEHDRFGMYLNKSAGQGMHLIAGSESTDGEKAFKVVQYVRSQYKWDGTYSQMATQNFNEFMKTKTGSSAELNLILVNLLRQNGIASDPVLIRTSDLGKPEKMYPVKNQFNHVIASAQIGNDLYLFDATGEGPGALNILDMGTDGLVIGRTGPGWVQTQKPETKALQNEEIPFFNL